MFAVFEKKNLKTYIYTFAIFKGVRCKEIPIIITFWSTIMDK